MIWLFALLGEKRSY